MAPSLRLRKILAEKVNFEYFKLITKFIEKTIWIWSIIIADYAFISEIIPFSYYGL